MKKPWFRVQLFEIAVINTLIWHSFLLPRCQQTQEFKTRSDEENGETCHLDCNAHACFDQFVLRVWIVEFMIVTSNY